MEPAFIPLYARHKLAVVIRTGRVSRKTPLAGHFRVLVAQRGRNFRLDQEAEIADWEIRQVGEYGIQIRIGNAEPVRKRRCVLIG